MNQGENFNTMAQKNFFRHDAEVNRKVFEHSNRGNQLFPKELIGDRIRKEIVRGEEFTQNAFELAKHRYYPTIDDKVLYSYLTDKHIAISTIDRNWFSDAEKNESTEYWKTCQQELFSKIRMRWSLPNGEFWARQNKC